MNTDTGGPAFPAGLPTSWYQPDDGGRPQPIVSGGMSLRDYFAAHALAVHAHCPCPVLGKTAADEARRPEILAEIAHDCYAMADAMLAERRRIEEAQP